MSVRKRHSRIWLLLTLKAMNRDAAAFARRRSEWSHEGGMSEKGRDCTKRDKSRLETNDPRRLHGAPPVDLHCRTGDGSRASLHE
ncbi:hypothetical protein EVAR_305_1 [Eumeta japonica]|uniref:Uncharacterized protein n=1 Tax=Eumeta variegata TaxID=151549 RepID=A0A4C1SBW4_EUMVA|nr:hypothetical protein EVAR_305_1 [Eumeta japonica]